MGKPTLAPPKGYRDDPEALSLHTTPDNYDYDDAPENQGLLPPSYDDSQSGSSSAVHVSAPPAQHTLLPARKDHNRNVTMKNGHPQVCETVTLMDRQYDTDPVYLEKGIRAFAQQAPFPLVYIMGSHRETIKRGDKTEHKTVTDFRIAIHLQDYLRQNYHFSAGSPIDISTVENGEKTYRGTCTKQRAPGFKQDIEVGAPKPSLTEWCHRYCASPRALRVFRLQRPVTGFDGNNRLKSRIEGLIRATSYRGFISVTFPVEEKNIDIYTTNRINEWRLKTWLRWVFYLSFLWIFSWPALFFSTKRYAVVRAEWPFSVTDSAGNKRYTTISEDEWFEKWQIAIRRLVLGQYDGEATTEVLEGVTARPEDPQVPGTFNSGLQGLDQAAGLLSQGVRFARAMQTGNSLGSSLQGGWGYDT